MVYVIGGVYLINCDESGFRIGQLIVFYDKFGYGGKFLLVKVIKKLVFYFFRGLK